MHKLTMTKKAPSAGAVELERLSGAYAGTKAEYGKTMGFSPSKMTKLTSGDQIPSLEEAIALEDGHKIPVRAWFW